MADSIDGTPHQPTPVGTLCCYCQHPIVGRADRIGGDSSMSGAKPDLYAHRTCGPRTQSISHGRRR
jgi:hypothetical protein